MIFIVFIIILILKALTDALFFRGKKRLSKWVEESWFIILVILAWTHNRQSENEFIHVIILYLFLRAALFDTFYNLFAKLPLFYKGSSSEWDDYMKRLKTWQYLALKSFCMLCAMIVYYFKLKQ